MKLIKCINSSNSFTPKVQKFHPTPFSMNCTGYLSTYKLAFLTYNSLITGQPGYIRSLINCYNPAGIIVLQVLSFRTHKWESSVLLL